MDILLSSEDLSPLNASRLRYFAYPLLSASSLSSVSIPSTIWSSTRLTRVIVIFLVLRKSASSIYFIGRGAFLSLLSISSVMSITPSRFDISCGRFLSYIILEAMYGVSQVISDSGFEKYSSYGLTQTFGMYGLMLVLFIIAFLMAVALA